MPRARSPARDDDSENHSQCVVIDEERRVLDHGRVAIASVVLDHEVAQPFRVVLTQGGRGQERFEARAVSAHRILDAQRKEHRQALAEAIHELRQRLTSRFHAPTTPSSVPHPRLEKPSRSSVEPSRSGARLALAQENPHITDDHADGVDRFL